jgi:hypothetical protein
MKEIKENNNKWLLGSKSKKYSKVLENNTIYIKTIKAN